VRQHEAWAPSGNTVALAETNQIPDAHAQQGHHKTNRDTTNLAAHRYRPCLQQRRHGAARTSDSRCYHEPAHSRQTPPSAWPPCPQYQCLHNSCRLHLRHLLHHRDRRAHHHLCERVRVDDLCLCVCLCLWVLKWPGVSCCVTPSPRHDPSLAAYTSTCIITIFLCTRPLLPKYTFIIYTLVCATCACALCV